METGHAEGLLEEVVERQGHRVDLERGGLLGGQQLLEPRVHVGLLPRRDDEN